LTKRVVTAGAEEIDRNPRARSAKLRAGERTAASVHTDDLAGLPPPLPSLADVVRGR
jgi:16S rRNA (cytosine1402-N4)-methyltransferase